MKSETLLNHHYEMLKMAKKTLEERPALYNQYLHRVMISDILPTLRVSLLSRNPEIQGGSLNSVFAWIATIDNDTFNSVEGCHSHFVSYLLSCWVVLEGKVLHLAAEVLKHLLQRRQS